MFLVRDSIDCDDVAVYFDTEQQRKVSEKLTAISSRLHFRQCIVEALSFVEAFAVKEAAARVGLPAMVIPSDHPLTDINLSYRHHPLPEKIFLLD